MNDLERRLTDLLGERAREVESELSGPQIRAVARRRRRVLAPLAAVAAVLAVVLMTLALAHTRHERHIQPGSPGTVVTTPAPRRSLISRPPLRTNTAAPPGSVRLPAASPTSRGTLATVPGTAPRVVGSSTAP